MQRGASLEHDRRPLGLRTSSYRHRSTLALGLDAVGKARTRTNSTFDSLLSGKCAVNAATGKK